MLRKLVTLALLALLALPGACRDASSGQLRPPSEECPARACGPQMGMPTRICPDGVHSSGPTGRCIKKDGGACGWEMATCP